jgi:taurine dioxygenase
MVPNKTQMVSRQDTESSSHRKIEVSPVTPTIGAEVRGVDLSQPLAAKQWSQIHDAFLRHLVLFFKGQKRLSPEDQIRFGRMFGELHVPPAAPHLEGYPEVFAIHTDKDTKTNNGERWHSDVSCDVESPLGSILQMHVLPPCGGDTMFSNMYTAYDNLSPRMREFLGACRAMHESEHIYRGRWGRSDRAVNDTGKTYPSTEHPVIRTHPETGKQSIFVNRTFTTRIQGLEQPESQAILQFLFEHVENPDYQVRFRWQENDVVMWDNRCAQYIAIWDYWPHERKGHRVTIKGDRPFFRA